MPLEHWQKPVMAHLHDYYDDIILCTGWKYVEPAMFDDQTRPGPKTTLYFSSNRCCLFTLSCCHIFQVVMSLQISHLVVNLLFWMSAGRVVQRTCFSWELAPSRGTGGRRLHLFMVSGTVSVLSVSWLSMSATKCLYPSRLSIKYTWQILLTSSLVNLSSAYQANFYNWTLIHLTEGHIFLLFGVEKQTFRFMSLIGTFKYHWKKQISKEKQKTD